jgi:membrane protease YdiL (CAAX protease family)
MNFLDKNIFAKLGKRNFLTFVFVLFLVVNIVIIFYTFILLILDGLFDITLKKQSLNVSNDLDVLLTIISVCIVAPVIETLLCQNLLIHTVKKLSNSETLQLIIPSIIFGLLHFDSIFTILHGFLMGLIFNFGFILYKRNKGLKQATYAIIVVHFLRNSIAVAINLCFN